MGKKISGHLSKRSFIVLYSVNPRTPSITLLSSITDIILGQGKEDENFKKHTHKCTDVHKLFFLTFRAVQKHFQPYGELKDILSNFKKSVVNNMKEVTLNNPINHPEAASSHVPTRGPQN